MNYRSMEELSSILRSVPYKLYFSQSWMLACELQFLHEVNMHHIRGSHFRIRVCDFIR